MNSNLPFALIFFSILAILFFGEFYLCRKAYRYLKSRQKPKWQRIGIIILFLAFVIPLLGLFIWRPRFSTLPGWFLITLVYPFYVWHFSLLLLFVLMMIGKLIKLPIVTTVWISRKLKKEEPSTPPPSFPYNEGRRMFLEKGIIILSGATFASSAYGAFRRNSYDLTETIIPLTGLPKELDGFTISMVSDIHSSLFMSEKQMQEYAEVINNLKSDLILVTGDFVNSQVDEVYPLAEAFQSLKAPRGVYGVLGNHDYYTGDVETVAKEVNKCGVTLLRNQNVAIESQGKKFYLLGVNDIGSNRRADEAIDEAMAGTETTIPKILMCHRPYFFDNAASKGVGLTLSGHTHGGQVVFLKFGANVISPARLASPYVSGLYHIGESKMYVNRGLGTVGIPIRLNCPPEVTRIVLKG